MCCIGENRLGIITNPWEDVADRPIRLLEKACKQFVPIIQDVCRDAPRSLRALMGDNRGEASAHQVGVSELVQELCLQVAVLEKPGCLGHETWTLGKNSVKEERGRVYRIAEPASL